MGWPHDKAERKIVATFPMGVWKSCDWLADWETFPTAIEWIWYSTKRMSKTDYKAGKRNRSTGITNYTGEGIYL